MQPRQKAQGGLCSTTKIDQNVLNYNIGHTDSFRESQNSRMLWVGWDLKNHPFHPLPQTGTSHTIPGCSKPCLALGTSREGGFSVNTSCWRGGICPWMEISTSPIWSLDGDLHISQCGSHQGDLSACCHLSIQTGLWLIFCDKLPHLIHSWIKTKNGENC